MLSLGKLTDVTVMKAHNENNVVDRGLQHMSDSNRILTN